MTDLDPKIWENPTLGEAGAGPFLPEIELQQAEDRNARLDGREPKIVEYVHRYPKLAENVTVPSLTSDVIFKEPELPPVADEDDGDFDFSKLGD